MDRKKRKADAPKDKERPAKARKTTPSESAHDGKREDKLEIEREDKDTVPEELKLAQHILARLLAAPESSRHFGHLPAPMLMTDLVGRRIRAFVQELLAQEPMATFARTALVAGDPIIPESKAAKARIGQLSVADFNKLWARVYALFPDTGRHELEDHCASGVLRCMFLRVGGLVDDLLPRGWTDKANLMAHAHHLSCNDMMRVVIADCRGQSDTAPAFSARIALDSRDLSQWLRPENKESADSLAMLIARGFPGYYVAKTKPRPANVSEMAKAYPDLFLVLVCGSSAFAAAILSLAPLECLRQGLALHFRSPGVADGICAHLDKAARVQCAREIMSTPIFANARGPMAALIAEYFV